MDYEGVFVDEEAAPATVLKKRLWDRCIPGDFVKFLKPHFLIEHL